jgi:Trk K+ transport system NAD-binding subunit
LRPNVPIIARASTRHVAEAMADFSPSAIVNPFDEYGRFLALSQDRPRCHQLISWLLAGTGAPLPPLVPHIPDGCWVVIADDQFGEEVAIDLRSTNRKVTVHTDITSFPDLTGVAALIAGSTSDTDNLAIAAHARRTRPEVFLAVRQRSHSNLPLLAAFNPDSVFSPSDQITQRVLTHLITPHFWDFIVYAMNAENSWAEKTLRSLISHVGRKSPQVIGIDISHRTTPAVARWIESGRKITVGDLLRDPDDREIHARAVALTLSRGRRTSYLPAESAPVKIGDELVIAGRPQSFDDQSEYLYDDSTLHYIVTGHDIPTSMVWGKVTKLFNRHTPDPEPIPLQYSSRPPAPKRPRVDESNRKSPPEIS